MKEQLLKQLGQNIKKKRLEQNLSQEDLADKAGFHRTYIGMLERGEKNITFINLVRLCRALEINVSDLVEFSNDSK